MPAAALHLKSQEVGSPGPAELLIRQTAIGINYLDIYYRSGVYPLPHIPFIPGSEAAGEVLEIGREITGFSTGDRIVYYTRDAGAYTTLRVLPADRAIKLPNSVSDLVAAAILLKGMTAHYLLTKTYQVKEGDWILVHAAAGGVGQFLCSWASSLGANVIGMVSSEEKAEIAKEAGCKEVIVRTSAFDNKFSKRVREIANQQLAVVYDSVGKDTYEESLNSLRKFGLFVSFGQSSGSIPSFDISQLSAKGSLYMTRPSLHAHTADGPSLQASAAEVFKALEKGFLRPKSPTTYPLAEVSRAHQDMEARKTTGSNVLIP